SNAASASSSRRFSYSLVPRATADSTDSIEDLGCPSAAPEATSTKLTSSKAETLARDGRRQPRLPRQLKCQYQRRLAGNKPRIKKSNADTRKSEKRAALPASREPSCCLRASGSIFEAYSVPMSLDANPSLTIVPPVPR